MDSLPQDNLTQGFGQIQPPLTTEVGKTQAPEALTPSAAEVQPAIVSLTDTAQQTNDISQEILSTPPPPPPANSAMEAKVIPMEQMRNTPLPLPLALSTDAPIDRPVYRLPLNEAPPPDTQQLQPNIAKALESMAPSSKQSPAESMGSKVSNHQQAVDKQATTARRALRSFQSNPSPKNEKQLAGALDNVNTLMQATTSLRNEIANSGAPADAKMLKTLQDTTKTLDRVNLQLEKALPETPSPPAKVSPEARPVSTPPSTGQPRTLRIKTRPRTNSAPPPLPSGRPASTKAASRSSGQPPKVPPRGRPPTIGQARSKSSKPPPTPTRGSSKPRLQRQNAEKRLSAPIRSTQDTAPKVTRRLATSIDEIRSTESSMLDNLSKISSVLSEKKFGQVIGKNKEHIAEIDKVKESINTFMDESKEMEQSLSKLTTSLRNNNGEIGDITALTKELDTHYDSYVKAFGECFDLALDFAQPSSVFSAQSPKSDAIKNFLNKPTQKGGVSRRQEISSSWPPTMPITQRGPRHVLLLKAVEKELKDLGRTDEAAAVKNLYTKVDIQLKKAMGQPIS